jgi:hypothetical protein
MLLVRAFSEFIFLFLIVASVLFGLSGTLHYGQAWEMLAMFFGSAGTRPTATSSAVPATHHACAPYRRRYRCAFRAPPSEFSRTAPPGNVHPATAVRIRRYAQR